MEHLHERDNELAAEIAGIPAGPPGAQGIQGIQGDVGPQGPAVSSPFTGPLIVTGGLFSADAPIGIGNDMNSSGESGIRMAHTGGKLQISARNMGSFIYEATLDLAGLDGGGGIPSVQDGDLLRYDAASQSWKPFQGGTQDVVLGDGAGGFITLHFVSGSFVSATGP